MHYSHLTVGAWRFRKPSLTGWAALFFTVALLLWLGGWQVQRLQEKQLLLEKIAAGRESPALALAELESMSEKDAAYRQVELKLTPICGEDLHRVTARSGYGKGYFLLRPYHLNASQLLLVNEGFVGDREGKALACDASATQPMRVMLRPPYMRSLIGVKNHPEYNMWFTEDLNAMQTTLPSPFYPLLAERFAEAEKQHFPIRFTGEVTLRNDHLGYAITWFSLSVVAVIMFAAYHYEKEPKP